MEKGMQYSYSLLSLSTMPRGYALWISVRIAHSKQFWDQSLWSREDKRINSCMMKYKFTGCRLLLVRDYSLSTSTGNSMTRKERGCHVHCRALNTGDIAAALQSAPSPPRAADPRNLITSRWVHSEPRLITSVTHSCTELFIYQQKW